MGIILTNEQNAAVKDGLKWFKKGYKQVFEITGPAGTGKTTIVKYIIDALGLGLNEVSNIATFTESDTLNELLILGLHSLSLTNIVSLENFSPELQ